MLIGIRYLPGLIVPHIHSHFRGSLNLVFTFSSYLGQTQHKRCPVLLVMPRPLPSVAPVTTGG